MKKQFYLFYTFIFSTIIFISANFTDSQAQNTKYAEIHCKHFIYGCPSGTAATNDLIIRDIYALSSNDTTKIADWVAYKLDIETITGDVNTTRNWKADPWLEDNETLEPDDYNGANAALKTDRGHQAPLASFKGTKCWADTNYLSNISPQKANLNQGPWMILEGKVRDLVEAKDAVYVMTGPLYEREMPSLPGADETHKIPSGYWKIIVLPAKNINEIKTASFIFNQDTPRSDKVVSHLSTIDEIERRSGLDFLWELPDKVEEKIENSNFKEWTEENFK